MRISDWSSDVCSSDLTGAEGVAAINQDLRIRPVLLSGAAGTRLWPLSRKHSPKQLLALLSDRSMLQATALRARGLRDQLAPMVTCHTEHRLLELGRALCRERVCPYVSHSVVAGPLQTNKTIPTLSATTTKKTH